MPTLDEVFEPYADRRLILKIRFARSVDTFSDLAGLAGALQSIDALTRTDFSEEGRHFRANSLRLRARIVSFYIGSPPEASLLTTLPWLAIFVSTMALFVAFTGNYHNIKNNLPIISNDIGRVLSGIKGLTQDQLRRLELIIRLTLDQILQLPEDQLRSLANRIHTVRVKLLDGELPTMEVIDIDRDQLDE